MKLESASESYSCKNDDGMKMDEHMEHSADIVDAAAAAGSALCAANYYTRCVGVRPEKKRNDSKAAVDSTFWRYR